MKLVTLIIGAVLLSSCVYEPSTAGIVREKCKIYGSYTDQCRQVKKQIRDEYYRMYYRKK